MTPEPNATTQNFDSERIVRRGRLVFREHGEAGVDASFDGAILWAESPAPPLRAPDYSARRRVSTLMNRTVWADTAGNVVARVAEDGTGTRVTAWEGRTGRRLWSREFPLPSPASFAEPDPPPGNCAEELRGLAALTDEALIVCTQRNTRCGIQITSDIDDDQLSDPDGPFAKLPAFEAQLDLIRLDPATGETLWSVQHPGIHVNILERRRFDGLCATSDGFGLVEWSTGALRELARVPRGELAWPRRHENTAVCAYHARGTLQVRVIEIDSGRMLHAHEIAVRRRHGVDLHLAGSAGLVNVDAQTYISLGHKFGPTGTFKAPGWFRSLGMGSSGELVLTTSLERIVIRPESGQIVSTVRI